MPRLILDVSGGGPRASVASAALADASVTDAREAAQAGAVIVTVDEVTPTVRQRLADTPGVTAVHDDLQGLPQIADDEEVQDFLDRVRESRGEDEAPATIETKPLRADGGATTLPAADDFGLTAVPTAEINNVTDSLELAGARQLHDQGFTGESVIAVVLDTGCCGDTIRADRQMAGVDLTEETDDPWEPLSGHGGMTAGIMAGDETTPGIDVGFLPDADVFPIKSTLAASELILAQDAIVDLAEREDRTVIVNNSWGFQECVGICDNPVTTAISNASDHPDVIQVFAAGNQGGDCGQDCSGTPGISGPNSLPGVISVAASGRDGESEQLQDYSSRGGVDPIGCGGRKPDLAAPIYGQVPYGCGSRDIGNNGGTSAACPQVAGTIGLLADMIDSPTEERLRTALAESAAQFRGDDGSFNGCSGWGNLRASEAANEIPPPTVTAGFGDTRAVAAVGLTLGILGAALRRHAT